MRETWDFLHSPAARAAWNMALDESLLHTAAKRGRPLLRVYAWENPSVSFGYFQKFPVNAGGGHDVVRRPTGGGVVYHVQGHHVHGGRPPRARLYAMKTADAYCALHQAVAAAFQSPPATSPRDAAFATGSYECFQRPVHGDVVADGRKLAGGAQRRTKSGLLHQGSIAAKLSVAELQRGFREALDIGFENYQITGAERAIAEKLVIEKYATDAWNRHLRYLEDRLEKEWVVRSGRVWRRISPGLSRRRNSCPARW